MSDDPFSVNPFFNSWIKTQGEFLKAQEPFWRYMSKSMPKVSEQTTEIENLWSEAQRQSTEWFTTMAEGFSKRFSGGDGINHDVLRHMLDPGQFMYAGSDEVNQTIQKLVEGPEFSDIGSLERSGLKATQEWITLREASAEYRLVTIRAWTRAFEAFSEEMLGNNDLWKEGWNAVTKRWLDIANDELIRTQRTGEFLDAQRKLLRAGVDYRLRERELVETWCETHSIPTRTEIDDLHKIVYQLRGEVRALKKQLKQQTAAPAKSKAGRSSKTVKS
jgi:class III poly(R)-hydroxyalkanoic acid synthase PhaE subunit